MRNIANLSVVLAALIAAALLVTIGDGGSPSPAGAVPEIDAGPAEADAVEVAPARRAIGQPPAQEESLDDAPPPDPLAATDFTEDRETFWIRGNVLDRLTGGPVKGLTVWTAQARTLENGVSYSITDPFGAFALEVPPGIHQLAYPLPLEGFHPPPSEEVVVVASDVFVTCYTYSGPLAVLSGHLLSEEGAPLVGVLLRFSPFDGWIEFSGGSYPRLTSNLLGMTRTREDGSFRIEVRPGGVVVHSNDFKDNPSTPLGDVFESVVIEARPGVNPPLQLNGFAGSPWRGEIIIDADLDFSRSYVLATTPSNRELRSFLEPTPTGARWVAAPPIERESLAELHLVLEDGREIVRAVLLTEGQQHIDL